MKEYTTAQAADAVGDISADTVRKFANRKLIENKDFKRFGRTIVLTESGFRKLKARNTKPGPRANGRKSA
jgi:hypothetical protein